VGLQTGQAIFGVIENMSYLQQGSERIELFGSGGGELVARHLSELSKTEVLLLGQIPISIPLREGSDTGNPLLAQETSDLAASAIEQIAIKIAGTGRELAGRRLPLSPR
jgi:ATP-binding protein involved in chromosome partitioning